MAISEKLDFTNGVSIDGIADGGHVLGVVGEEEVLLVRSGAECFAVGAHCTHYQGPLADGLVVGDQVRCPWHHACFNLRTGEALHAPALDPIPCWKIERRGNTVFVREKIAPASAPPATQSHPSSIVIIGGGAAGLAAADMLRRKGYAEALTIISADAAPPCDRPNLSKDFLAGSAAEDWIPLRPAEWYREHGIQLILNTRVTDIDTDARTVHTESGQVYNYESMLLATGADPIRIPVEGATPSQLFFLRSFADSKAIIAKATQAQRAVVVGASFIGLEVAASLRTRGVEVHVVAPETIPMAKVLGTELGTFVRGLHESHGVVFHLGETVKRVDGKQVALSGGGNLEADFLVLGVGVSPSLSLAERARLKLDRGIVVNQYLETSAPGVFAAGDAARWPDPHTGERIRVEHWVVAERQGQTAAKNMLGLREPFEAVPFFWSQHYDVPINYAGHAERWDHIEIEGNVSQGDCAVRYKFNGRRIAVATVSRDIESLMAELQMEQRVQAEASPQPLPRSA